MHYVSFSLTQTSLFTISKPCISYNKRHHKQL